MTLSQVVDQLWSGEKTIEDVHPLAVVGEAEDVADRTWFVPSFANASALGTDEGLVMVDTGSAPFASHVHGQVRRFSRDRLHTAIYSHGHVDHVFGVGVFEEEATVEGWPAPRVVAHEALPKRFDRYVLTAGFNTWVNRRQFQLGDDFSWPTSYRYPDLTYRETLDLEVGGLRLELHHARGETDDHTWTWVPERKVLCCGDLFIWASPNAGNPQKVQRYPKEWANALRQMLTLGAEVLLPGHGWPLLGADRVREALTDTADLLDHLHDETVALMNAGATLDDVVHTVKAPPHLLDKPYLRPVYDEPEFVVRNTWRLYGGWWDGDPSHLKPAPASVLAQELASLVGGAEVLARRALEVDDLRLAGHLAELAVQADPPSRAAHEARAEVNRRRVAAEASTMSKGVFSWAQRESEQALGS